MSYTTYTTRAIVCGKYDKNTDDGLFLLFTEQFGMVFASARSVRLERSRQRYALQEFSLLRVSLVKGRNGWKIGSVEPEQQFFTALDNREMKQVAVQAIKLTRRFVVGESAEVQVFADLLHFFSAVTKTENATELYHIFALRLLATLGYVEVTSELAPYTDTAAWSEVSVSPAHNLPKIVQSATESSHL